MNDECIFVILYYNEGHLLEVELVVEIPVEEFSHAWWQSWFISVSDIPYVVLGRGPSHCLKTH